MITEPLPKIHPFSSGYFLIEGIYVEPSEDVSVPMIQDHVYAFIQDNYYESRPTPILLRHSGSEYHFEIHPSENVRIDTIEMPFKMVDDMNLDRFPAEEQFLLAKPRHSHNLYQLSDSGTKIIE